uniref:major capsid protein n=1 Tax=Brachyspira catarrhinii TaxID=2528966 RepID=UPI003F4BDC7E
MPRLSDFHGSVFNGFAKLGQMYDQGVGVAQFNSYFYDMFKKSSVNRNYNGNVIDLSTKLKIKRMSDYSKTREEIPDPFNLSSETIESYKLPDIKETYILTPETLEKRMAKEPYYYQEKHIAGMVLQEALHEAIEAIRRRNEKSAIEALTTGKIVSKDGTEILTFPGDATHITTPANTWDTADADPMKDLVTMCDLLYKDGGVNQFDVYMGTEAFNYFIDNEKVQKQIKILTTGEIKPILEGQTPDPVGISSWSPFMTSHQNIITIKQYNNLYDTFDADGLRTGSEELFPSKEVLIMAKGAPLQLGLGKPAVLKPQANANYQYLEIGEYVVTIESRKTDIEMIVWYCGSPLINSMDRIATIKAAA